MFLDARMGIFEGRRGRGDEKWQWGRGIFEVCGGIADVIGIPVLECRY
jgi:hypothetical protein